MVEIVEQIPHRPSVYDQYADGKLYKLKPGKDFTCKVMTFRSRFCEYCKARGLSYITRVIGGFLYIKVLSEN